LLPLLERHGAHHGIDRRKKKALPWVRVGYDPGDMAEKDRQADDAAGALLGVPTGDDSLSRDHVDDLEFSAKQRGRPQGVSRDEYMKSGPGEETRSIMALAGMARDRSPHLRTIAVIAVLAAAAAGALLWWLLA
jgi:hypothetical protein